jgi:hypothetical protein
MSNKSGNIVKHTAAELRRMEKRGEVKTDWDAAAKKSLPSGGDPDDAMEEVDELTTEMPKRR